MKVVQLSQSGSPELPVRSNFLLGQIVRGQTVFSIRHSLSASIKSGKVLALRQRRMVLTFDHANQSD